MTSAWWLTSAVACVQVLLSSISQERELTRVLLEHSAWFQQSMRRPPLVPSPLHPLPTWQLLPPAGAPGGPKPAVVASVAPILVDLTNIAPSSVGITNLAPRVEVANHAPLVGAAQYAPTPIGVPIVAPTPIGVPIVAPTPIGVPIVAPTPIGVSIVAPTLSNGMPTSFGTANGELLKSVDCALTQINQDDVVSIGCTDYGDVSGNLNIEDDAINAFKSRNVPNNNISSSQVTPDCVEATSSKFSSIDTHADGSSTVTSYASRKNSATCFIFTNNQKNSVPSAATIADDIDHYDCQLSDYENQNEEYATNDPLLNTMVNSMQYATDLLCAKESNADKSESKMNSDKLESKNKAEKSKRSYLPNVEWCSNVSEAMENNCCELTSKEIETHLMMKRVRSKIIPSDHEDVWKRLEELLRNKSPTGEDEGQPKNVVSGQLKSKRMNAHANKRITDTSKDNCNSRLIMPNTPSSYSQNKMNADLPSFNFRPIGTSSVSKSNRQSSIQSSNIAMQPAKSISIASNLEEQIDIEMETFLNQWAKKNNGANIPSLSRALPDTSNSTVYVSHKLQSEKLNMDIDQTKGNVRVFNNFNENSAFELQSSETLIDKDKMWDLKSMKNKSNPSKMLGNNGNFISEQLPYIRLVQNTANAPIKITGQNISKVPDIPGCVQNNNKARYSQLKLQQTMLKNSIRLVTSDSLRNALGSSEMRRPPLFTKCKNNSPEVKNTIHLPYVPIVHTNLPRYPQFLKMRREYKTSSLRHQQLGNRCDKLCKIRPSRKNLTKVVRTLGKPSKSHIDRMVVDYPKFISKFDRFDEEKYSSRRKKLYINYINSSRIENDRIIDYSCRIITQRKSKSYSDKVNRCPSYSSIPHKAGAGEGNIVLETNKQSKHYLCAESREKREEAVIQLSSEKDENYNPSIARYNHLKAADKFGLFHPVGMSKLEQSSALHTVIKQQCFKDKSNRTKQVNNIQSFVHLPLKRDSLLTAPKKSTFKPKSEIYKLIKSGKQNY